MARVLVVGATGYVGKNLVPQLLGRGHEVQALVRNSAKAKALYGSNIRLFEGDALKSETLPAALQNTTAAYYLVHSMTAKSKAFVELDRVAATNFARAAKEAGVARIIYLGGLGKRGIEQSPHLRSRHEVGDILRAAGPAVTEFRAAAIIGSGSASFEMVHHLVNRLPVMVCPRWVLVRTQPIAIDDVLRYLSEALDRPESAGKIIDIGGPQIVAYGDLMRTVAKVLGLKRLFLNVPVLTPRLSSYWVNLVTPIHTHLARSLIDSLRYETVCENNEAAKIFGFETLSVENSIRRALAGALSYRAHQELSGGYEQLPSAIDPSHLQVDQRSIAVELSPEKLFAVIQKIGGENGYYYANWLWRMRGAIDKALGGIGMRRGRNHPTKIKIGETIDFWRVEQYQPGKRLLLRAEMNIWGQGWLEFMVEPLSERRSRLIQTVRYYPRGLWGFLYWHLTYPLHALIFRNMARRIAAKASLQQTEYAGQSLHGA